VNDIDQFASSLFDEAKRFLEKAKDAKSGSAEAPNLHAALMLAFCSLEAHINAVADEFSVRSDLSIHERGILIEQDVQLVDGRFEIIAKLRIARLEDRLELLHQRFSKSGGLDLKAEWRAKLSSALKLRNKLTHPKSIPSITISAIESALLAVIETIDALYSALYDRPFPAANRGLTSTLDF
jgi:hypothetical protein